MRRLRFPLLGLGCAAMIAGTFVVSRDTSEEGAVRLALRDVPEVAREGDAAAWIWLRTAPMHRGEVEARLSRSLEGRRGWSRDATGWNYNPNYAPVWWSRVGFLRDRFPDRRPALWIKVSEGRAMPEGDPRRVEGPWTTVRLEAMALFEPSPPRPSRWAVRR